MMSEEEKHSFRADGHYIDDSLDVFVEEQVDFYSATRALGIRPHVISTWTVSFLTTSDSIGDSDL
jgi:hypothetical protein